MCIRYMPKVSLARPLIHAGALSMGDEGPLRPPQRFHNLRQLAMTPADAFSIPLAVDKENVNTAAFYNKALGKGALHMVNNGAACKAELSGLPASVSQAVGRLAC